MSVPALISPPEVAHRPLREWREQVSRTPQVAYLFFLLATFCIILPPTDLISRLDEIPLYEWMISLAALAAVSGIAEKLRPDELYRMPISAALIGMNVAIPLSHLSHAYPGGAYGSSVMFLKTTMYFLVLTAVIENWRRLRGLLMTISLGATCTIGLCLVDYHEIVYFPNITHMIQYNELDLDLLAEGEITELELKSVQRMCGMGIFHDPNDVSLLIVAAAVLCWYWMTDRQLGVARWLWIVPIGILLAGLVDTRSRGGLLALFAAAGTLAVVRYRAWGACAVVIFAVVSLPIIGGRQAEIDLADGTGQERIQLWSEAMAELKSPSLLFGIGQGNFAELAGYVAHNSFVHAYVELGLFGGTFFFGMFLFAAMALWRACRLGPQIPAPELSRLVPAMLAILIAWMTGLFSLSRCYVVSTYLMLGMSAATIRLIEKSFSPEWSLATFRGRNQARMIGGSLSLFVGLYVLIRILVRFPGL